jgi:hypothetical protein
MAALGMGCVLAAVAIIVYVVFTAKPIHTQGGYLQPKEPANPVPPHLRRGGEAAFGITTAQALEGMQRMFGRPAPCEYCGEPVREENCKNCGAPRRRS